MQNTFITEDGMRFYIKEPSKKALFDELTQDRLGKALEVSKERGGQYGDTLRTSQCLVFLAVAKELGFEITRDQAMALTIAGLVDVKYSRFEGGWKLDNIDDGINYQSVLPGLVEIAKQSSR